MARRLLVPLATLGLVFGSMMMAASAASAAPAASHPATGSATVPGFRPGGLMTRPGGAISASGVRNAATTSTNWSGYAVTGGNGAFHSVSASWTQPSVSCSSTRYASFWVGLDGFSSNSVEQTGTDSDCSGSSPRYYGWYEMYPAFPVNFSNPVSPGDHMSASVTFSGTTTFTLVLKDTTKGWTQTITKNQSGLARSSAEVITEAPSSSSGVLPLADFHTVTYSSSAANGTSIGSQNPTSITMVNSSGADKDTTSAINSSGGFSNTWVRSS
ncbi:MAG TPA: G1 family glutamic endopeptidase [Streptosporangiaceae bacterium]|nr:G1 family glutamic endopeptidase [Streptosporangiaceae bacterium]